MSTSFLKIFIRSFLNSRFIAGIKVFSLVVSMAGVQTLRMVMGNPVEAQQDQ